MPSTDYQKRGRRRLRTTRSVPFRSVILFCEYGKEPQGMRNAGGLKLRSDGRRVCDVLPAPD